ncbi:hypothetical protein [Photobacterium sp. J15]|uniref:hypothetical protein n=1 Tax=Photobacterium sp. J15 TaxID=265901 RepID=UPI0007E3DF97|nr:hypothetical protein [Photobacterium sp. J15]
MAREKPGIRAEQMKECKAQDMPPLGRSQKRKGMSMHEGIAPWCDCCVCEAEPYWAELADEMGISLSDYEDDQ